MSTPKRKVNFLTFFMIWSRIMGWQVPPLHIQLCQWLENCSDPVRVLMVFRGAAKSTLYAIFKAWKLYCDPTGRSLVWSEDTRLAKKMTRDVIGILRRHPLCKGMLPQHVGADEFWCVGYKDNRNPSMAAYGVLSNATGSRADDIDFDDIEVPKNIRTPEAREKLRDRTSEATHILVPGGQKTYIGTPHTHDSMYDEQIEGGAALLKIPMFAHQKRFEADSKMVQGRTFKVDFDAGPDGYYVFIGIHKFAMLLEEGVNYKRSGRTFTLALPPNNTVDIYAGSAWPERFDRKDLIRRRRDTRTLNAWDSQYQLEAKPLHAIRLNPDRLRAYDVQPVIEHANGSVRMMLGQSQIVSASAWWDCALGRLSGDDSALSIMLQNARGNYFWHVAEGLTGDVFQQCQRIRELVLSLQIPRVVVETNGPGAFAPPILRKALHGTGCGVGEEFSSVNKNKRILDAFEAPLSGRFIWAHVDVIARVKDEMKDWKPNVKEQPDNFLDSGAGAISEAPQRIGKFIGGQSPVTSLKQRDSWRPNEGHFEAELSFDD